MRRSEKVDQRSGQVSGLTEQQEYFLTRLHDLVAKRAHQIETDPKDTFSLRLLARGLYSTYMDCVASGIGDQAADVLGRAQTDPVSQALAKTEAHKES